MITDAQVQAAIEALDSQPFTGSLPETVRAMLEAADRAAWQGMESAPVGVFALFRTKYGLVEGSVFGDVQERTVETRFSAVDHFADCWRHLPGAPSDD